MTPTQASVNVGDRFKSTQKKDRGRTIEIVRDHGGYYTVSNVLTSRRTVVNGETLAKNYERAAQSSSRRRVMRGGVRSDGTVPQPRKAALPALNDRQREVLRIVKGKFSDFNRRQQHFYLGGGMSTTHVVQAVMADQSKIYLFWPRELIERRSNGGITYRLADKCFERAQNAIRDALKELERKGYLEKLGNTDERRWKPTYIDS